MRILLDTSVLIWIATDERRMSFAAMATYRDPFDRMLICQALDEGLTIVTPDQLMKTYPVATMW